MKKVTSVINTIALLCMLLVILYVILRWNMTPESIPVHYDAAGIPNRYGAKLEAMLPLVILCVMYGILTIFQQVPYNDEIKGGDVITLDKEIEKCLLALLMGMEKLVLTLIFGTIIVYAMKSLALPSNFLILALFFVFIPVLFFLCYYLSLWKTKKQPN